jgi:hypothetical protein
MLYQALNLVIIIAFFVITGIIFLSDLAKSILDFSGRTIKRELKYGIWNIETFDVGLMIAAGTTFLTSFFVPNRK